MHGTDLRGLSDGGYGAPAFLAASSSWAQPRTGAIRTYTTTAAVKAAAPSPLARDLHQDQGQDATSGNERRRDPLEGRRPPASAGVEVTTRQVTVVQHADPSVLVHRVKTALVVRPPGVARGWPRTMSKLRSARDNSGKRMPS